MPTLTVKSSPVVCLHCGRRVYATSTTAVFDRVFITTKIGRCCGDTYVMRTHQPRKPMPMKPTTIALCLLLTLAFLAGGCAAIAPDAARYQAVKLPVKEYQANHPERATSYGNLMAEWRNSLLKRGATTQQVD